MSTNDVPGANIANGDSLHIGCWAEHDDGSLIFVEGVESDRVVYSMFDVAKTPIIEYRDAMPETNFNKQFSFGSGVSKEKWTWHDKTPFPWERVIKRGADAGIKYANVEDQLTAAERVGKSLLLRAREIEEDRLDHMRDHELARTTSVLDRLQKSLDGLGSLPGQIGAAVSDAIQKAKTKRPKKK